MSNVRRPTGLKPTWFELLTAVTMYVIGMVLGAWFVTPSAYYVWMAFWGLLVGLTTRDVAHWIRSEM